jgi:invasion protein IalB
MIRFAVLALIAAIAAWPASAQQQKPAEKKPAAAPKNAAAEKKATPAVASDKKETHVGRFGDWDVFETTESKAKVCYMATPLQGQEGAKRKAYVLVMHRPSQKALGVVSVTAGFAYKDKSDAEAEIGAEKFPLYTSAKTPDTAWAYDDAKLLQAMLKGNDMVVRGTPAKGNGVTDKFSLDGVTKAYQEMNKACDVK